MYDDLPMSKLVIALWIAGGLVVVGALAFGVPQYFRYQRLANERNITQVNDIMIAQTSQLVQVQKQKAQIKVEEAKGIAESQTIINKTLTPLYIQHEAIQAQESQSNKIIYVPSGSQGIPLVQTVQQ